MTGQSDLGLVSTSDLIAAVMGRFDSAIFHGRTERPIDLEDGMQVYTIRIKGEPLTAIGMAHSVASFCQKKLDALHQDIEDDDL